MSLSKENSDTLVLLEDESNVYYMAARCIELIDSSGGIGCHKEGVIRVAQAIIKMCNSSETNKISNKE